MPRLLDERRKDRLATVLIRVGGILVIVVVAAIVVNIGLQALPLFFGASIGPPQRLEATGDVMAAGSDPRREAVWTLGRDGVVRFDADDELPAVEVVDADDAVTTVFQGLHGLVALVTDANVVHVGEVRFRDRWTDGERRMTADWRPAADPLSLDAGDEPFAGIAAAENADGTVAVAVWSPGGALRLGAWDADDEQWQLSELDIPPGIRSVAIAEDLGQLAIADGRGDLEVLRLPSREPVSVADAPHDIVRVLYLIGGGTLVAATRAGEVEVLLTVPYVTVANGGDRPLAVEGVTIQPGDRAVLPDDQLGQRFAARPEVVVTGADPEVRPVRRLRAVTGEPRVLAGSDRGRGFMVGTDAGQVALYHATSGRRLLAGTWGDGPVTVLSMDPKADGAVVRAGSEVVRRAIRNPHPEVSLRTLFLPVWYEGYAAPKWVWQSTGGADSFEPKMSLWPLIFGTFKATLYAMLLSVPVALMAAVYVSRLAPPWLQTTVKPTLELMAAVPSVVVGFLAALWLAPRLEKTLLATGLGFLLLPIAVAIGLGLWRLVPRTLRLRAPEGTELMVLAFAGLVLLAVVPPLARVLEATLFGGDFQRWLFTDLGVRYDQRNALVVGLGLGFAVIPVIFTIAEDACSAVPDSLVNASRALGATRWQTAVRLVVPAASPGLFAAVMLGLGRAVGETMIVLMAAGNTPLLDGSPFNGMRTMSAAIAVEIPEAPVGGTLFRVLFLTGTLLFVFTFLLTTVADMVGAHLRKRYARF